MNLAVNSAMRARIPRFSSNACWSVIIGTWWTVPIQRVITMLICWLVSTSHEQTKTKNCREWYDGAVRLLGQRDKPFVRDDEHELRTPRPDLLDRPYAPDYTGESLRKQYKVWERVRKRERKQSSLVNIVAVKNNILSSCRICQRFRISWATVTPNRTICNINVHAHRLNSCVHLRSPWIGIIHRHRSIRNSNINNIASPMHRNLHRCAVAMTKATTTWKWPQAKTADAAKTKNKQRSRP